MRTLLFVALLCAVLPARSQNVTLSASATCDVFVRGICYDPNTCQVLSTTSSIVLAPGDSEPLSSLNAGCSSGQVQGYEVCLPSIFCNGLCQIMNDGTTFGCYPTSWPFICGMCTLSRVEWQGSDLVIY